MCTPEKTEGQAILLQRRHPCRGVSAQPAPDDRPLPQTGPQEGVVPPVTGHLSTQQQRNNSREQLKASRSFQDVTQTLLEDPFSS